MTWPLVPLSAVAEVVSGYGFPRDHQGVTDGPIPFFKVGDMNLVGNERFMNVSTNTVSEETLRTLNARKFPPNTIIFPKIGAAIATNKKRILTRLSTVDNNVMGLIPKPAVDPLYLFYWLEQFDLSTMANIGPVPSMRKSEVEKIFLPMPPVSEQRRIVEILDQADALRRLRTEADAKAQRILPALFLKMFGDPATNPMGWPVSSLEQEVEIGTELVDPNLPRYLELPHIGGENIERETGIILPYKKVRESALKSNKFYFSKEHVLYSKIRPYLNKVAFPEFEGVCSADIYPLRPRSGKITQWYLIGLLRLPRFLRYAAIHSERLRMPKLNREQLGAFPIPLPDIDILRTFDRQARDIAVAASLLAARRDRIEELLSLFTHRAFSGELTARWREAHREQLCAEMAEQAKLLKLPLPEAARALA
ncbi:MAG TPA: restriction endonuclease subunit S [Defluviicoccus sp.]|nr:restriction endonuclease subunit S [Defluviicoccus sp.]